MKPLQIKRMIILIIQNNKTILKVILLVGISLFFLVSCSFFDKEDTSIVIDEEVTQPKEHIQSQKPEKEENNITIENKKEEQQQPNIQEPTTLTEEEPAEEKEFIKPQLRGQEIGKENSDETKKQPSQKQSNIPFQQEFIKETTQKNTGFVPSQEDKNPKNEAAYWDRLEKIVKNADSYFKEQSSNSSFISKDGKLYNYTKKCYIDIPFLCNNQGLDEAYRSLECAILFLQGNQLAQYDGIDLKNEDKNMTVFAVTRHPSLNKYMFFSANGSNGSISEQDYQALLKSYEQNHGGMRRLTPLSEEYERILNFIRVYESRFDPYFVRNITMDDKYASVVFSSQSASWDVRQLILVRDETFWEVVMDGMEKEANPITAINRQFPDFNLNILPSYALYNKKSSIKTNYNDVLSIFLRDGVISSIDDVYYVSGTDEFCYVVLQNHSRYMCTKKEGEWYIKWVPTYKEAYDIMIAAGQSSLTFILLDE